MDRVREAWFARPRDRHRSGRKRASQRGEGIMSRDERAPNDNQEPIVAMAPELDIRLTEEDIGA